MTQSVKNVIYFLDPHQSDVTKTIITLAHELGHGAFTLKHSFEDYPSLSQGSTDNLMDYNTGTVLWKKQWDKIHDPATVLGLFEDDESGASVGTKKNPIVQVYFWNKTSGKDVGHTAIRIGEVVYGYYPTDIDGDGAYTMNDLKNSPGVMHINSLSEFNSIYSGDAVTEFTLKATTDQIIALQNKLQSVAKNPGNYSLVGDNCTSIAYNCLQSAGFGIINLDTSIAGIIMPTLGMSPGVLEVMLSNPINRRFGPVQSSSTFTVGK